MWSKVYVLRYIEVQRGEGRGKGSGPGCGEGCQRVGGEGCWRQEQEGEVLLEGWKEAEERG